LADGIACEANPAEPGENNANICAAGSFCDASDPENLMCARCATNQVTTGTAQVDACTDCATDSPDTPVANADQDECVARVTCTENGPQCDGNPDGLVICPPGGGDCLAPVTVSDCTANPDADCAANTDGNTVCVNNVCTAPVVCQTDADCAADTNGRTSCGLVANNPICIAPAACTTDADCAANTNGLTKCAAPSCTVATQQFFFQIVVDTPFDATLNDENDDRLGEVQEQLQDLICAGLLGCTVTVTGFDDGSTIVNGNAVVQEGSNNDALLNNVRNQPIPALGANARVTASSQSSTNFDLCTEDAPCTAGQGDCDNNNECAGDLECGINNCPEGEDPLADCCYDPTDDAITGAACDGTGLNMWTCCATKDGGCGEGEGDCDSDSECTPPLVCGRNSCSGGFNTNFEANSDRFFPAGQADCCITKSRALFYGIPSRKDLEEDFQNDDEPF